jgi:pimeloyl-ACP methyl ester carboxylesterase
VGKVRLKDVELSYEEYGSGDPLILVHGSLADATIWREHSGALSKRYRVVVPTQRYFGADPWVDDGGKFSVEQHGRDLVELLERLGIAAANLIGWSYGGAVSLWAAILRPDLFKRLVLYEPALASHIADAEPRRLADEDRMRMTKRSRSFVEPGDYMSAVEAFVDDGNDQVGTFGRMPKQIQAAMRSSARTLPLSFRAPPPPITPENLMSLRLPTTVGCGSKTRSCFRIAASAAVRNPAFAQVTIEGARHLWPLENVSQCVSFFFESVVRT